MHLSEFKYKSNLILMNIRIRVCNKLYKQMYTNANDKNMVFGEFVQVKGYLLLWNRKYMINLHIKTVS